MTTQIIDFSEIDLTGGLRFNGEAIGAAHYNGERLWPFGVDLLYTDGIGGASYLPDPGDVYGASALAAFGDGVAAVLDEKNGTPVLGPELVSNGSFDTNLTGWTARNSALLSVVDGRLRVENGAAAAGGAFQQITTVAGRFYLVTFDFTYVDRTAGVAIGTTQGGNQLGALDASQSGILTGIFRATGTTAFITARINSSTLGASALFDNISVREISGIHALQASASLRPLLGRASRRGRVNLYSDTERGIAANTLFGINAAGSGSIISAIPGPDGDFAADLITLTNATDFHMIRRGNVGSSGQTLSFTARLKPAGYWKYAIADAYGGYNKYAAFDLQSKTVIYNQSLVGAPYIEELDDGWFRIGITAATAPVLALSLIVLPPDYVAPASAQSALFQWQADGVSGFYFGGLQAELGGVTAHQRVSANLADISDPGIRSDQFVRFDLSDDRLDTVLPQAVTGDVVIAGRNGSVIAPHSYAANSTFQLGPTSYTGGTPGILRAIGDVVGWSVLDKTLTAAERERLMRFYKRRGAKGLLLPGPELAPSSSNLIGYFNEVVGATLSQVDEDLHVTATASFGGANRLDFSFKPLGLYLVTMQLKSGAGRFTVDNSAFTSFPNITFNGPNSFVGVMQARNDGLLRPNVRTQTAGETTVWTGFSIRELRPEEEW